MRNRFAALTVVSLLASTAGCANPLNAVHYQNYWDAAVRAEQAGDKKQAKIFWSRAIINAQIGALGPKAEASALFRYGQAVAELCELDNTREAFSRALRLLAEAEEPEEGFQGNLRFELAHLELAQLHYAEAVKWYDLVFPRMRMTPQSKADPIGFANELDSYATALEKIGDFARAAELRKESEEVRKQHPDRKGDFTPYRYNCLGTKVSQAQDDERYGRWEQAYGRWQEIVATLEAHPYKEVEMAPLVYNRGRAAGVTCRFEEAERDFLRARELDVRTGGRVWEAFIELAYLNFAQKNYTSAVAYAKQGLDALEPVQMANADFLDMYAASLDGAGNAVAAAATRQTAQTMRERYPNPDPGEVRVRYGSVCPPAAESRARNELAEAGPLTWARGARSAI